MVAGLRSRLRASGRLGGLLADGSVAMERRLPAPLRETLTRRLRQNPWRSEMVSAGFLFVHVPKCAGTTVWRQLGIASAGHATLEDYLVFDRQLTMATHKFCVIRNPWDRLVSAFHFLRDKDDMPAARIWKKNWLTGCDSFQDFLGQIERSRALRTAMMSNILFRPQTDFISVRGSVLMDDMVRLEHIDTEMPKVFERFGLTWNPGRAENVSQRDDYRGYFRNPEQVAIVDRLYYTDISALGYRFGD